jgi:hypothetical protein
VLQGQRIFADRCSQIWFVSGQASGVTEEAYLEIPAKRLCCVPLWWLFLVDFNDILIWIDALKHSPSRFWCHFRDLDGI